MITSTIDGFEPTLERWLIASHFARRVNGKLVATAEGREVGALLG